MTRVYISQDEWVAYMYADGVNHGAISMARSMIEEILIGLSSNYLNAIGTTSSRIREFIDIGELSEMIETYLYRTSSNARRSWPR